MSKFLKSMIVLLAIVAMATPVLAEDMLSLGGQMRVRGWHIDAGGDNTDSRFDQRLRIGGKISVADGVSVTFRTDTTEATWGANSGFGSGRLAGSNGTQWDRAHLDINLGGFSVRAGQQYVGFGQSGAFNAQDNGLKVVAGPVTAFFMVDDNNGSSVTTSDDYFYGANFAQKSDSFKANFFVVGQKDDAEEVYLIGADAAFNFDAVKLVTELNIFTGDASATADAFGTQLFVDVSMAASEAMTFGGQLYYALGDDTDVQYVVLGNDFGGWDPLFAHGTGLDNEQIGEGRPFGFFGSNAGVIAARVYADAKVSDAVKIGGSLSYLEPEEDANVTADSAFTLAVGMKYAVMSNTSLGVQVEYVDVDDAGVEEEISAGVGLFVNF